MIGMFLKKPNGDVETIISEPIANEDYDAIYTITTEGKVSMQKMHEIVTEDYLIYPK